MNYMCSSFELFLTFRVSIVHNVIASIFLAFHILIAACTVIIEIPIAI